MFKASREEPFARRAQCAAGARGAGGQQLGQGMLRPGSPGDAPALQKSNSKSIASTLGCSLSQKLKGRLQTAALPPRGTAENPDPGVSRGVLATEASQRCCKPSPHPEPARSVCFTPFSQPTAHRCAVKWFTPLQWGGVASKPHKPLGALEGEASRWCRCLPSQRPRRRAVRLSHTQQTAPEE